MIKTLFNTLKSHPQLYICGQIKKIFYFTSRKDNIFTISLIGRPNVGKSSIFNRLSGGKNAITDQTPGLTRDRKEIITNILNSPIRLVDTAGVENINKINEQTVQSKMQHQTIQALIYSDVAMFIVDVREGITHADIQLARFLKKQTLLYRHPQNQQNFIDQQNQKSQNTNQTQNQLIPTKTESSSKVNNKNKINIQKIILIANKSEREEDTSSIANDIYKLGLGSPIFVSAEQGDGFTELLDAINNSLPIGYHDSYEHKQVKRMEKHLQMREKFKQEIISLQQLGKIPEDFDIQDWEREFDMANDNPEENSDLDSDSEVDPLKTMNPNKPVTALKEEEKGVSSENFYIRKPIQLSIVGRPNTGKSTFVNSLLQEQRVIVDDLPGTTRDSINIQWVYKGRRINLVDTAGIDRKLKKKSDVQKKCNTDALRTVNHSQVTIVMIDALRSFQFEDISIAQYVASEGRAMIIVVNKWDLVPEEYKKKAIAFMQKKIESKLSQVRGLKMFCVSAKSGINLEKVMDEVLNVYEKWNFRVSTGTLNDWLHKIKKIQNAPTHDGNQLKIRFISQVKSRPPTFVAFVNDKHLFKINYLRFLRNKIADEFKIKGVPIRFEIRDIGYRKMQRKLELKQPGKTLKKLKLKQRRIARFAKVKLEELSKLARNSKNQTQSDYQEKEQKSQQQQNFANNSK